MKLSENQEIIEALKHILQKYEYLEYDDEKSRNNGSDLLYVKVTGLNANRNLGVITDIVKELTEDTQLQFMPILHSGPRTDPDHTDWAYFSIKEM